MAATAIEELVRKHTASKDRVATKYERVFHVTVNDETTAAYDALHAQGLGLPEIGDAHPSDVGAVVRVLNPTQMSDDPLQFEVKVEYSTSIVGGWELHPLLRPAHYEWSFLHRTEDGNHTLAGDGIVNSAGQLFDPPVPVDTSLAMLRVTRNESESSFQLYTVLLSPNVINHARWPNPMNPDWGQTPMWTAKMADIRAMQVEETYGGQTVRFWQATYEIQFRWDYWQPRLVDQGYAVKIQPDGPGTDWKLQEISGPNGSPLSMPTLLDGRGELLGFDFATGLSLPLVYVPWIEVVENTPFPDPEVHPGAYFSIYRVADFDALRLFSNPPY